jgi:hypothetical protein
VWPTAGRTDGGFAWSVSWFYQGLLGHHSGFAVPVAIADPREVVSDSIAASPARKKPVPLPKLWEM